MSTSGATAQSNRLPHAGHAQRSFDKEAASVKLRDRQRFFEEVLQHDVETYLSASHLHMDSKKPPVGSISSMEVNVDILEQMDLMEISDHEALDVFLNSGSDESVLTTTAQKEEHEDELEEDNDGEVISKSRSRTSSTSSTSSQDNSEAGTDTPIVQSDEEEVQVDNFLLTSTTSAMEERDKEEVEEEQVEEQAGLSS